MWGFLESSKGNFPRDIKRPGTKHEELACERRRGVAAVEAAVEPVVAPVPPLAVPVEATDNQVVVRAAVDGTPEEDGLALPFFGDQLRMSKQVIEDVGVENWLIGQFLSQLVPHDVFAVLLVLRQIEQHLLRAPLELAALAMLCHTLPILRQERIGVEIDDVPDDLDLGEALKKGKDLCQFVPLRKQFDICGRVAVPLEGVVQLRGLTSRHNERV